jgi:hypothetical protein
MSIPLNTHAARMTLSRDPGLRSWAEQWLKDRERAARPEMTAEEFEKHWMYVTPRGCTKGRSRPSPPTCKCISNQPADN